MEGLGLGAPSQGLLDPPSSIRRLAPTPAPLSSSTNRQRSFASALTGCVDAASSARPLYPKLKSTLPEKVPWGRGPHQESHWQYHQVETVHRTMKKGENTRSHSWWWDSHINPKNSKWLQDNLSEMDTKVNAMLKIIEEDADSFAQRAEMYYKKRPELINLVEEFYRTYRALVERYTFLTREIRQNMAPALQAQLGVSSESAQNSPVDLHLKRGGLDGPDIISPSYSYAGASEFDCDSPFSARGPVDEDELSPSGFGTYGFMPKFSSPDVSTPKASESRQLHGTLDALQKDVFRLQDENRALTAKSSEDATRLKSLQLELSGLQAKFRSLEADDKLNKKRLKSVQDQEKRLEAENLRLSHALITSKEERTELAEQHSKVVEESKVASQNNRLLEDEMVALRDRMHAAQVQALERLHKVNEAEEATQKLQQALTALEEQRSMDALQLSTYERQSHDLHSNILEAEEEQARLKEEILAQEGVVKTLEAQLMDLKADKAGLEQLLLECKEELKALKHEREESSSKMAMLQRELEEVCNARESLSDQVVQQTAEIARLKEALAKFEEEKTRLEIEKLEASKYLHKLEADIEEGRKVMETLKASHQQEEERCKALQSARSQLEEELISRNEETTRLGKQIATLEVVAVDARLQIKELEKRVSSLAGEKTVLTEELELASERIQVVERECLQMHEVEKGKQEKVEDLERRCMTLSADIERLEASLLHVVEERSGLVKRESETLQAHQRLEAEHRQLRQDLEKKLSLTRDLEDKLSQMENEKNEMALEMHQLQQSIAGLTEQITSLNSQLFRSKADQEGAEEAAKKAQREHVSEREQLQEEMHAKAEQICELRNHTESLEAQLAQLMEEKSLLTGEIEEYMRKLASVDTQTHALSTSLSNSLSKVAALSEQSYEKDKKIDLLSSELSTSNSQVVALNEELTAQTNHVLSLQDQLHALQEQVGRLHEEAQKSSETIQSLERVVDRLQQQVFEGDKANHLIVQEKQRVLDELLLMKEASRGLETDLINLREERELLLQKASAEYKNMEQRIKGLEGEFEATRSESEALREQLANCEEEKKTLEEENTSCSRKLFETEGRIQDLQLRISKLLVEKVALTDQVSEKMKALHTIEAELLDMERDKAVLGEEVHLLKQQVHTLEGMEASLLADLHTSSELNQNLRVEIKALQQQVSLAAEVHEGLAQKSLDESLVLKRQIEDLQASSSLLIKEKSLLTRDMASHSAWSKELEVKVERSEDEKASLQQDLSSALEVREKLNEDLKASNEEKDQLSQALDSCKKEMKKQEEELENLQQALSHVKEEHGATVDNMNLLMEEKEALERAHLALLAEHRESKDEAERARSNLLNLETGLSHLQQMNATFATELYEKIQAVKALHEEISSLQGTKDELEEKLQVSSTQLAAHEAEAKALQEILASAQHENRRLRVVSVAEEEAAQGRIIDASEDCSKRKETSHVLKQEVAAVISVKAKLEEELASLQEEQTVDKQKMESMQREMIALQEQQTQAMADLNAAEKRLQEEIAHLKALGLQEISNLQVSVAKLETEVCRLQAERKALEEDKALTTSQMLDLQQEMEVLRLQLSQKEGLVLSSTAQLDRLQRDFSSTETEMASLKEAAQKDRESFGAAKEALKAELHICEREVVSKGAEISDLTTTLHGLEQSNKMLMEDKALTTAQILDLQQQIEVLRLQLLEKEELVFSLSAQVDQLQRAFSSTETEMAGLKEAAQKDRESFGAAEEALKAELLVCQREVAFKGAKISELTTSLHGLEQSNKMLLEEKALTTAWMLDLQQQVQALQLQLSEKEELALTLSVEVDHLQRAFSSTETEMAGLKGVAQKERESFGAAEEALKAELLVCQREVASKGAEISELTTSLHGLEQSNKMLMEDKTLTTAQMLDLQQQMKVLRLELLEKEELALSLAVQVDRLERAFSSAETEMVSLREIAQKDRESFGAAEEALKAELLFRQREVASKGAEILELTTTLHGLEQSNKMLMEEMSAKELLHLQAQEGAKVLMEENMELTHRLKIGSADLLQSREEGEALAAELHELRDRLLKLQSLHDDIEAANQAQAEEKSLLAKQIKESTSALSELQEENAVLRVNLAVKSTALIDAEQDILLLKEQFAEPDDRFGLHEGHATRSIQINDEAEETTRQADMDKLDLLEKELAAARGDNDKLRDMISAGATAVTELQEETAKLHVRNQNLQEESELVHTEVKRLKGELSNVQKRAECLDAERMGLKEQLEDARTTQSMLLDLQGKSLAYSLLLKENLVSSCKGIKAIAEELQKFVSDKRANQIMEGVEKLSTLQNLCDGQGIVGKKKMHSAGESSLEEVAMKSLQHKGSWPNVSKDFVLEQLNRRVEEMDLLHDAVGTMMPPFDSLPSMDQNAALQSTIPQVPKEVACESEIDEHHDPLLIQGQQLPIFASMAEEHDTGEMSSTDDTSSVEGEIARKLVPQEYEALEMGALDHSEQIQLMQGLARLHINLGMRLHQAMMDEKLELELLELKEERKRLQEDLQARVEQVQRMESELEKLQALLKEGSEKDEKMRKVERRARRLSEELVLRRQQVGNMQEVVMSWAQQQEMATEKLEEQVLSLVSTESAPTMEGWDAEQVNLLMKDMQMRKALTRRHSLELQSVGQELQKVGSSIESTHRQLIYKEEQDGEDDDAVAFDAVTKHGKPRRLGLAWFRLLLSKERKGLLRRSRSKRSLAIPALTTRVSSSTSASSTSMSTWLAQTKRLGCCACGLAPHRSKSLDDKERSS